jgi:hypothetical protein
LGLGNVLFGRKKLKAPEKERLFALSTAGVTLETELGLKATAAGVCFKPLSAAEFVRAENELQELLAKVTQENGTKLERSSDTYGFEWLVLRDPDLEDLVTGAHAVGDELIARGFGAQLLASVFRFQSPEQGVRPVFWLYGYKRGAFWPFVPTGDGQGRDNARELELQAKLEHELPIEPDITRWFGVFDSPL